MQHKRNTGRKNSFFTMEKSPNVEYKKQPVPAWQRRVVSIYAT
jgi:hypothetical protein